MTEEELKQEAEENSFRYTLDKPWACEVERKQIMAHFEKGYLAGVKPREKRIAELEKENAELKGLKDVATLIRANNDTVITLMQLNNMLVSKSQQLSKAKEIIREFVEWATWQGNSKCPSFKSIQDKAEQFLNSEVEK